jgi:type IV pilus biogenesis protein CpaD/CtpE
MEADRSASHAAPESPATTPAPSADGLSRRDFARLAIVGAAAAALPASLASSLPARAQSIPHEVALSPAAKQEADLKSEIVLGQYGSRLTDAQKAEVRHLTVQMQSQLEKIRAYKLENGDAPATVFEPYRKERS